MDLEANARKEDLKAPAPSVLPSSFDNSRPDVRSSRFPLEGAASHFSPANGDVVAAPENAGALSKPTPRSSVLPGSSDRVETLNDSAVQVGSTDPGNQAPEDNPSESDSSSGNQANLSSPSSSTGGSDDSDPSNGAEELFALLEQPHSAQRKSYSNENRYLLPNPLTIGPRKSFADLANPPVLGGTVSVKLVDIDGNDLSESKTSQLLSSDGLLTRPFDAKFMASFALKVLGTSDGPGYCLKFTVSCFVPGKAEPMTQEIVSTPFNIYSNRRTAKDRPVVTRMKPDEGFLVRDTEVWIKGRGFNERTCVTFGGRPARVTDHSSNLMIVLAPARPDLHDGEPTTVTVEVFNRLPNSSETTAAASEVKLKFTYRPLPTQLRQAPAGAQFGPNGLLPAMSEDASAADQVSSMVARSFGQGPPMQYPPLTTANLYTPSRIAANMVPYGAYGSHAVPQPAGPSGQLPVRSPSGDSSGTSSNGSQSGNGSGSNGGGGSSSANGSSQSSGAPSSSGRGSHLSGSGPDDNGALKYQRNGETHSDINDARLRSGLPPTDFSAQGGPADQTGLLRSAQPNPHSVSQAQMNLQKAMLMTQPNAGLMMPNPGMDAASQTALLYNLQLQNAIMQRAQQIRTSQQGYFMHGGGNAVMDGSDTNALVLAAAQQLQHQQQSFQHQLLQQQQHQFQQQQHQFHQQQQQMQVQLQQQKHFQVEQQKQQQQMQHQLVMLQRAQRDGAESPRLPEPQSVFPPSQSGAYGGYPQSIGAFGSPYGQMQQGQPLAAYPYGAYRPGSADPGYGANAVYSSGYHAGGSSQAQPAPMNFANPATSSSGPMFSSPSLNFPSAAAFGNGFVAAAYGGMASGPAYPRLPQSPTRPAAAPDAPRSTLAPDPPAVFGPASDYQQFDNGSASGAAGGNGGGSSNGGGGVDGVN